MITKSLRSYGIILSQSGFHQFLCNTRVNRVINSGNTLIEMISNHDHDMRGTRDTHIEFMSCTIEEVISIARSMI